MISDSNLFLGQFGLIVLNPNQIIQIISLTPEVQCLPSALCNHMSHLLRLPPPACRLSSLSRCLKKSQG